LQGALSVWLAARGEPDPATAAQRLLDQLKSQIERRTLTLTALVDEVAPRLTQWMESWGSTRSLAMLRMSEAGVQIAYSRLAELSPADANGAELPPFTEIPQSFKPTPKTLPLVLAPAAWDLYSSVLERRLKAWVHEWPDVALSAVTSATFSLDLLGASEREICIQVGRARVAGGGAAGAHPLKLGVNLIWAAERLYELEQRDPLRAEESFAQLERLVKELTAEAGMPVRGIPRAWPVHGEKWMPGLRQKIRGDEKRRPELVMVREEGVQEGYGWHSEDREQDVAYIDACLDAVACWLGPPQYQVITRRATTRVVPGMVPTRVSATS
jgi:hypothetical protein